MRKTQFLFSLLALSCRFHRARSPPSTPGNDHSLEHTELCLQGVPSPMVPTRILSWSLLGSSCNTFWCLLDGLSPSNVVLVLTLLIIKTPDGWCATVNRQSNNLLFLFLSSVSAQRLRPRTVVHPWLEESNYY
jgi:hypothetical protein